MNLFVDEHGPANGPAVALLHGVPSRPDDYVPLARALAAGGRRALIVHAPGYGRSAAIDGATMDDVRAAIVGALRARAPGPIALVGFSGGAWRALDVACRGLLDVTHVACLGGLASLDAAERAGFEQFATALDAHADLRAIAPARFLSPAWAAKPEAAARVTAWLDATSPANLARELRAFATAPDVVDGLRALAIPVLARTGEVDQAAPAAKARAICASTRASTLEIVDGAGHALLIEDEAATIASVVAFLTVGARRDGAERRGREAPL